MGYLPCDYSVVGCIDEVWFYCTNGRKIKIKLRDHELIDDSAVVRSKMLSMKFPVKSMFIGVAGHHLLHRGFNGRMLLERVSKRKVFGHANFIQNSAMMERCDLRLPYFSIGHQPIIIFTQWLWGWNFWLIRIFLYYKDW